MTETKEFTVSLGPLDSEHMESVRAWRNDWRIWQYTRQNDLINDVSQASWFKRQAEDPCTKMYVVQLSDEGNRRVVGVCGFTGIDYQCGRAEFSIYVAPQYHRQGLGRKSLELLLEHGFKNHGFRLIHGETFDGNPAAKLFESLGFKREGTRRQFYWKDGKHVDAHVYSILREEWNGSRSDSSGDHRGDVKLPDDRLPPRHPRGVAAAIGPAPDEAPRTKGKAPAKGQKRGGRVGKGAERGA